MFQHLLDNATIPLVGSGIGSVLVAGAMFLHTRSPVALVWLLCVYLTIGVRIALIRRCRRRVAAFGYLRSYAFRFALTVGLSGCAWGACAYLLAHASDGPTAVLIVTAIQGMVMGAALTLGAYMPAFFAFSVPAMVPMIGVLAFSGQSAQIVIAIYSAAFLVLLSLIAARFNRSLRQTWQLRFENEDLVRSLTEASDKLALLAHTDGLTGLANRTRFDDVLDTQCRAHATSDAPISLILLDVDHFKQFNDTHGHLAGDACLKQVARIFKAACRDGGLAARYGGEEFAILLPETDLAAACAIAEAIRERVAAWPIAHDMSTISGVVTVSLGVATLDRSAFATPADLVALADAQLYLAKAQGRNRVSHHVGDVRSIRAR
ncbi:GGDEF domain-containing protein [Pararobbsia silviterrae]|nr:diguanylate cyclase [Pararobbsia silviterrae]